MSLGGYHVCSVGHDIAGIEVVKLEDVVYHLLLSVLNDAFLAADIDHHTDLLLRDGLLIGVRVKAEQAHNGVGGDRKHLDEGLCDFGEREQNADNLERDLFGRLHGYALGRKLAEYK